MLIMNLSTTPRVPSPWTVFGFLLDLSDQAFHFLVQYNNSWSAGHAHRSLVWNIGRESIGKESPIWDTVLALSMRLSVYSGLTFKNLALEDIEHLRHKSAVKKKTLWLLRWTTFLDHTLLYSRPWASSSPWLSPRARQVHCPFSGSCCLREGSCTVDRFSNSIMWFD